jgi:hypothetical protein
MKLMKTKPKSRRVKRRTLRYIYINPQSRIGCGVSGCASRRRSSATDRLFRDLPAQEKRDRLRLRRGDHRVPSGGTAGESRSVPKVGRELDREAPLEIQGLVRVSQSRISMRVWVRRLHLKSAISNPESPWGGPGGTEGSMAGRPTRAVLFLLASERAWRSWAVCGEVAKAAFAEVEVFRRIIEPCQSNGEIIS